MPTLRTRALLVATVAWLPVPAFAAPAGVANAPGATQSMLHDGLTRAYLVRTPRGLAQRGGRVPLVIVLHGGGGNAANAERMTGFTEKAAKEGFIVVYPEGTGRRGGKLLAWNAGHCCGLAMRRRVDDVGFIGALIDKLSIDYPVDPKRIYATGMSNGGMMTHRLGLELSDRVAAIAPVVATVFGDEREPARPVPALMINGMLDKSVPFRGGPTGGRFSNAWDGTPARPALDQAALWARANGCTSPPDERDRGSYLQWQYRCPAGRAVELRLVKDGGHAWPGGEAGSRRGDRPGSSFDATDVIWAFFKAHPR